MSIALPHGDLDTRRSLQWRRDLRSAFRFANFPGKRPRDPWPRSRRNRPRTDARDDRRTAVETVAICCQYVGSFWPHDLAQATARERPTAVGENDPVRLASAPPRCRCCCTWRTAEPASRWLNARRADRSPAGPRATYSACARAGRRCGLRRPYPSVLESCLWSSLPLRSRTRKAGRIATTAILTALRSSVRQLTAAAA